MNNGYKKINKTVKLEKYNPKPVVIQKKENFVVENWKPMVIILTLILIGYLTR